MALQDPVVVYIAATNMEADLLAQRLSANDIEAASMEDVSTVGAWMFGLLPRIHRPKVWVERRDVAHAEELLREYESEQQRRRNHDGTGPFIDVVCEECRKSSRFPDNLHGSTQDCVHCGAFVDVGDETPFDDWAGDQSADREDC